MAQSNWLIAKTKEMNLGGTSSNECKAQEVLYRVGN
jgi:hypothetical protein